MTNTLTIGMATHRDADGVMFTVNDLRLHHADALPRVELIVVDNDPGGPHTDRLKGFLDTVARGSGCRLPEPQRVAWRKQNRLPSFRNVQYVEFSDCQGTAAPRDEVFKRSTSDFVEVCDSHVWHWPGAVRALLDYIDANPASSDLIQGPLMMDDLMGSATHFSDIWRGGMWGVWGNAWLTTSGHYRELRRTADDQPAAYDLVTQEHAETLPSPWAGHERHFLQLGWRRAVDTDQPFEIPAQGLGLFVCRRQAWLGFHPSFREFGGEEWYIHTLFRQMGRRCLCLPQLKWVHRFSDANEGRHYRRTSPGKVRNYILGHKRLGLPLDRVRRQFLDGLNEDPHEPTRPPDLTAEQWDTLVIDPERYPIEFPPPATAVAVERKSCGGCNSPAVAASAATGNVNHMTLEQLYERAVSTPGDINEHCPKLRELAAQCEAVVEFGMRPDFSTVALLAGQPVRFATYAPKPPPNTRLLQRKAGRTLFTFAAGDSLSADIEPCDLLFIDTFHNAVQLAKELDRHAAKVRRWIALHDTRIYGNRGDDGGQGLLYALRRFMREHPEWSVIYHTHQQYGFTVISRDDRDKPKLPPLARKVWNFAGAFARDLLNGQQRLDDESAMARLDICSTCPLRNGDHCSECGCPLHTAANGQPGKVFYPLEACPLGYWQAIER